MNTTHLKQFATAVAVAGMTTFSVTSHAFSFHWFGFGKHKPATEQTTSEPPPSIVGIVDQNGTVGSFDNDDDFDILYTLVANYDDIATALSGDGDFTVFAPSDKAFIKLANDLVSTDEMGGTTITTEAEAVSMIGIGLTNLIDNLELETSVDDLIKSILLYHVSPGAKSVKAVRYQHEINTLLDDALIFPNRLKLEDADPNLKDPKILWRRSNLSASNGIIHTIDRVLIPINTNPNTPTIAEIVVNANGDGFDHNAWDYDILLAALQFAQDNGSVPFVDLVSDPANDFTVFAPRDGAFYKLAIALDLIDPHPYNEEAIVTALAGIGVEALTNILLYHVSSGTTSAADLIALSKEGSSVVTLLPDQTIDVSVRRNRWIQLIDGNQDLRNPWVTRARDIEAENGIIHTINRVLIPAAF